MSQSTNGIRSTIIVIKSETERDKIIASFVKKHICDAIYGAELVQFVTIRDDVSLNDSKTFNQYDYIFMIVVSSDTPIQQNVIDVLSDLPERSSRWSQRMDDDAIEQEWNAFFVFNDSTFTSLDKDHPNYHYQTFVNKYPSMFKWHRLSGSNFPACKVIRVDEGILTNELCGRLWINLNHWFFFNVKRYKLFLESLEPNYHRVNKN